MRGHATRRLPLLALLIGLCGMLAGCEKATAILDRFQLKEERVIVERTPDRAYDALFPYWIELCTLSQMRRKDGARGNPFGHALMYLKGACKDETAAFPQLRRCRRAATAIEDPEHGAGVSVGRFYRNVNWVAIPGYGLFYAGNLKPGERLTQERFDATVQAAIDSGVYDGVELHAGWNRGPETDLRTFVADRSITTDFALQFARNVFCARVPVSEAVLDEVMAFLNDKNREYATGEADYNWNLFTDNCVHTVRNSLAAANVWPPISVLQLKIRHVIGPAVPANEFVNLALLGSQGPLDGYEQVMAEDATRDALHDFRWLPTRHGALVKTLPVQQPNDLYDTDFRLFVVQSPWTMGKRARVVDLLGEARNVDLAENLRFFIGRYDALLERHRELADGLASVRGTPDRRVGRIFYEYLQAQRSDAAALAARLAVLQNAGAVSAAR